MSDAEIERVYPQRLHHETPGWVKSGACFHIRLRAALEQRTPLTEPKLADELLLTVQNYHERLLWHCSLMLLMPDHIHALLAFPADAAMNKTVGAWKRYATRALGVKWQANFFDHRIRNEK
jgi:REP element-mobilizing transposase RayT